MEDKQLKELKKEYYSIAIPDELDSLVKQALEDGIMPPTNKLPETSKQSETNFKKITGGNPHMKNTKLRTPQRVAIIAAASVGIFITSLNISPALALSLSDVPGIGNVVKVLTFREYTVQEGNYQANVKVPAIEGLDNKNLEETLNAKYLEENKKLYEAFMQDIAELKEAAPEAHMLLDTQYEVKTDNEQIFSIGRITFTAAGSSNTVIKYDTIDKKNQVLITLPSLFKDDQYIAVISDYIKAQMLEEVKAEKGIYFIKGSSLDQTIPTEELFDKIDKEQSFYINPAGKLVISFDKYEVAPGYMGVVEFVIPSNILKDLLISNLYIQA